MREMLRSVCKKATNVLNNNIYEKYALPIHRKDMKVYFVDKKSKQSEIIVACLSGVFNQVR